MRNTMYFKLALVNLKNNRRTFVPYLLACIGCVLMFYNMLALRYNPGLSDMPGAAILETIFQFGVVTIGIFSLIILFYTNSFLMKRRKKEVGLYSILGLEKRHIAKILSYETLFTAFLAITVGLLGGVLFGKLVFLALLHLTQTPLTLAFVVTPAAAVYTALLFLGIFLLTLLVNLLHIRLSNPIGLLRGGNEGEKEPKASWILTLIGIAALGGGYTIAVTVDTPLDAVSLFFFAVLLVIIGTYALFTSGSIKLLKLLKKSTWFYYKPRNFVSIASMMYRMKQNAVGLATICILSTMVLVTLSSTLSLYLGASDMLRSLYPNDVAIHYSVDTNQKNMVTTLIEKQSAASGTAITPPISYRSISFWTVRENGRFRPTESVQDNSATAFEVLPLADYNTMSNSSASLRPEEILLFSEGENYGQPSLTLGGQTFQVKEELASLPVTQKNTAVSFNSYYLVVDSMETLNQISGTLVNKQDIAPQYTTFFNFMQQDVEAHTAFYDALNADIKQVLPEFAMRGIDIVRQEWFSMYGGFLFLGVFLGLLFLMATVLIIYYKQISEGYDDHDRFAIMQKVGMSQKEVRQTINKQILTVFFLPLAGAVVHILFAFSVIRNLLLAFHLSDTLLFFLCTSGTVAFFAAIYVVVYLLTARTYYKIVEAA